jgi:hypothetical protein
LSPFDLKSFIERKKWRDVVYLHSKIEIIMSEVKDFNWVEGPEPHRVRTRAIVRAHPEVKNCWRKPHTPAEIPEPFSKHFVPTDFLFQMIK